MSMRSYANFGLAANLHAINEAEPELKELYQKMMDGINEAECTSSEIVNQECPHDVQEKIYNYQEKVQEKFDLTIFPVYISSEAEGTSHAGETVWMIDFMLSENEIKYSLGFETWTEVG